MLVIIAKLKYLHFIPDTENQCFDSDEFLRFFHTEDITLDKEMAQGRIYDVLLKEYGNDNLINNLGISKPQDINLQFSTEI